MNSTISAQKKQILDFLAKYQLKEAFESLIRLSVNVQDWHISEKLSELEMTYRYMLRYQFEGSADPEREAVYKNTLRSLYELTDDVTDEILSIDSNNILYERIRINALRTPITITDYKKKLIDLSEEQSLVDILDNGNEKQLKKRDLAIKRERIDSDFFNAVFIAPRATAGDYADYLSILESIELPSREKCLFLSALTLSLIHRFDARKVQVLMSACESDTLIVSQRATVGLIILLQIYDNRWNLYPQCQQQLDTLSENIHFRKSVLTIVKQLIRSRETEEISRKMTEEIIPEMMKLSSKAKRKLNMDDILGDSDFSEKNPEWKKDMEESGLANKLQEYSNLQIEGADVFHSTFANLKSFTFFNDLSNWFLPFDPSYSELQSLNNSDNKDSLLYTAILNSGQMCNSDKYSFSLSLLQIPSSQREMIMNQFGEETEEMKKLQQEAMSVNPNLNDEIVSNQYIQDLYRFFKVYPYKNNFLDIFSLKINFYETRFIAPLISDIDSMKQIASYCFDKNFLSEALAIYSKLSEQNETSDIWQKIGYCKQIRNDFEGALDAYLHADLLLPDNTWTLKRIAHMYRTLKRYDKAIEFYQKAARVKPNDLTVEMNIGHCYLEQKEYEKALNCYFKIEMLSEKNSSRTWRPIAWTAFLMHRFDLARKYYDFILADKPNVHDYLNAGHVELCEKNYTKAVIYYKTVVSKENENIESFINLFNEDRNELIASGVDKSIFPLLFDQLRYEFN
ncbi:MAG: tetratricopeptide repeat protein [Dysgonomonas sp.]